MAHIKPFDAVTRRAIAQQISVRYGRDRGGAKRESVQIPETAWMSDTGRIQESAQLKESIPVWSLRPPVKQAHDVNIGSLVKDTGSWHHQVHYSDGSKLYARSVSIGKNASDHKVVGMVDSDAASKIDGAIDWLDVNSLSDDAEARLLEIPSYQMIAFWLASPAKDEILIVTAPPKYLQDFELNHLYSSADFLGKLSKLPPIVGVPLRGKPDSDPQAGSAQPRRGPKPGT